MQKDILQRNGIARQHLSSYNEFVEYGLQSIIDEVNEVIIDTVEYPYKIKLGKLQLKQPRVMELDGSITNLSPLEARLRNLSYAAPIMLESSVVEDGNVLETKLELEEKNHKVELLEQEKKRKKETQCSPPFKYPECLPSF